MQTNQIRKTALKILIYTPHPPVTPQVGDIWQCDLKLKPVHALKNSGTQNPSYAWLRMGVSAKGYVDPHRPCRRIKQGSLWHRGLRWREALSQKIRAIAQNSEVAGLMVALVTGLRDQVTDSQVHVFRNTGTSHLMAISGLHIGLIAWLIYKFFYWGWTFSVSLCQWGSGVRAASWAALCLAALYSSLAGWGISTQRAFIMIALLMFAKLKALKIDPWQGLALALVSLVFLNPMSVLETGFGLSFLAVAWLFYINQGWPAKTRLQQSFQSMLLALGLMPLTLFDFGQVALLSVLANFVAIPWVAFLIVPESLLATLLLFVWPYSASLLFRWVALNLQGLMHYLTYLSMIPFTQWHNSFVHRGYLFPALVMLVWLLSPRGFPARYWGVLWLLPVLSPQAQLPKQGTAWVDVLDVGQGLGVVVRTAQHVLIYDVGDHPWQAKDRGETVVLPFLRDQGIKKINRVVLSHADRDHIGGFDSLRLAFPKVPVLAGDYHRMRSLLHYGPMLACQRGQHWTWEGVMFRVLAPKDLSTQGNTASCVLEVKVAKQSVWLTGDMTRDVEEQIMHLEKKPRAVFALVAPHHGSHTASSAAFVQWLTPKTVIFSTGYANRYHFPHPSVVRRYRQQGSLLYNTAYDGAIHIQLAAKPINLMLSTFMQTHEPWWARSKSHLLL